VPAGQAAAARRQVVTRVERLPPRRRIAAPIVAGGGEIGRLVISGVLLRRTTFGGRTASEPIGPGDVIATAPDLLEVPEVETTWTVCQATRLAVLDDEFARTAAELPGVLSALLQRSAERTHSVGFLLAVAQLPRLEMRLLALLWHLAQRWGTVERDGIVVELPFSHATLGELVAARRPSVATALSQLVARGQVVRRPNDEWLLPHTLAETEGWFEGGAAQGLR
jgi:CRP/FNR family transcriptional regulator, cyclic AMP receptor protein